MINKSTLHKDLPDGWDIKALPDCVEKASISRDIKIPQSEYLKNGKYPIIDQGADFIAGFTDDDSKLYEGELPVVVFGDHTRIFKYVNFPFSLGADGTKLLCPKKFLEPKYFYFYLLHLPLESKGYNRHYKYLKEKSIIFPEKTEQQKIALIISKIQLATEKQEKIIEKTKELKRSLMHRLFTYGLWGEELKETEIGLMPESWETKPFESLCENVKDSWNPGQYLNGIYVGLEHIESGNSVLKSFGTAQNLRSSKFIFSEGDILYGKLRPYLDKAVITNKKGICSTDILVFRPKNNVPAGFIVNLIHWSPFIEYAKKTTHGVNHPRTSWNSIRNFTCGIPQYEEQKEIASILSSIDEKIERERQREYQFRALFKSMLQLLMTGQVRVKDIDFGEDCE